MIALFLPAAKRRRWEAGLAVLVSRHLELHDMGEVISASEEFLRWVDGEGPERAALAKLHPVREASETITPGAAA